MSDLDLKEQNNVRTALRHFRLRLGAWSAVAKTLHCSVRTMEPLMSGRNPISASLALRVARLANVSFDDLVAGHWPAKACPRCGHVPDFVNDEVTNVEEAPRPAAGLTLVK